MILVGRGKQGRGKGRRSLGREGEKGEGCEEGDGVEQGRTSGAGSNDGDGGTSTAPTTVLSHTRRRYITTHLTTERHFSKRHPTTPSGTRDQQAVLHTPSGGTSPSARRCGRRDDVSSSPFPSDVTRLTSTTKTSPQSPSVTSSTHQQPDMTLPCLLPFVQANGSTRPTTPN